MKSPRICDSLKGGGEGEGDREGDSELVAPHVLDKYRFPPVLSQQFVY